MPAPIEFYFDPISPYGYLATTQIEAIAARHGRVVDWKPVLLGITVMKVMGLLSAAGFSKIGLITEQAPR